MLHIHIVTYRIIGQWAQSLQSLLIHLNFFARDINLPFCIFTMLVSDLHLRASRFEKEAAKKSALDQRKQEKDRIVRNRVAAKKAAHDLAVAEQVRFCVVA